MKIITIKFLRLMWALMPCFLGVLLVMPPAVYAADVEIYVNNGTVGSNPGRPNVLFFLDNSESMEARYEVDNPFDPSIQRNLCGGRNFIYYTAPGSGLPSTATNSDCYNKIIYRFAMHCNAALAALDRDGFYSGRFASLESGRWRPLSNQNFALYVDSTKDVIECEADQGTHGANSDPAVAYVNDTGYSASAGDAVNWSTIGSELTIYSQRYVAWYYNHRTETKAAIDIVKDVVKNVLEDRPNINAGLMHFNQGVGGRFPDGGRIAYPVRNATNDTTNAELQAAIDSITTDGVIGTPLAETLYEAKRYFWGESIDLGNSENTNRTHGSARNGNNYRAPAQASECQRNFVVLLTDGRPIGDQDRDTQINTLVNSNPGTTLDTCGSSDSCLDEMAEYMYLSDRAPAVDGMQSVITHTIGFDVDFTLLNSTASNAGGRYFTLDDPTNTQILRAAFDAILVSVNTENTSVSSPVLSVDQFNRSTNSDELYFALFEPAKARRWGGNIKKFRLDFVRDASGNPVDSDNDGRPDPAQILAKDQEPAINPNTGGFNDNVTSFWTQDADAPDGGQITKGGFASVMFDDVSSRKVYTYTGSSNDMTSPGNVLSHSNTAITAADVGAADASERERLLKWAAGIDVNDSDLDGSRTDIRPQVGAVLHSRPATVYYGDYDNNPDTTDTFLFAATNDGYLHMIDASDGSEKFSYMPPEVLPRLKALVENDSVASPTYALDGDIVVWRYDADGDGTITHGAGSSDHVYIYFGQRRGGSDYFALDVTDPDSPKRLWTIHGGVDGSDFEELGDTWSTPRLGKIRVQQGSAGLVTKQVLIFGGGYDQLIQDNIVTPFNDFLGRAIYIVDAETGEKLWFAGSSTITTPSVAPDYPLATMTNSIPSAVAAIDTTTDGFIDRIYVGDMRGQLWRFDIDNETNSPLRQRITGGRIAQMQKTSDTATVGVADSRRFFYPPNVALGEDSGGIFIALSIGSGYRSYPLNTQVEDRIYMIKDRFPFSLPDDGQNNGVSEADYTTMEVNESDLLDRTRLDATGDSSRGWYIRLADHDTNSLTFKGEKVLASATVFGGVLFFSTYTPGTGTSTPCSTVQGKGKAYAVDLYDGSPVTELDGIDSVDSSNDPVLTAGDRAKLLKRGGIPPEPVIFFIKPPRGSGGDGNSDLDDDKQTTGAGGGCDREGFNQVLVGPETLPCSPVNSAVRTYWRRVR